MTDKQIIIDGVNVSGCLFYYDNGKCSAILGDDTCKDWHNCSYKLQKQLKRKEQECEELKEKLIKWLGKEGLRQSEKEFYEQQLDQLKAENKELKEELEELKEENEYNEANAIEFKQTLIKIKEIAEHCIKQDICTTCNNSDRCHIEDEEIPTYDVCKLILQKISECEG